MHVIRPSRLLLAGVLPAAFLAACSSGSAPSVSSGPTVQAVGTQTAANAQSVATQVAPTAQAVATRVAPTAQALATQAAPTAQAIATQVAPAVQAAATQAPAVAATAQAAAPVRVAAAQLSTSDSTLTLEGTGSQPVNLSGWTLDVNGTHVGLPANAQVLPGQPLTIHTATGTSSGSNVFLGQEAQNLSRSLKPGARVTLMNQSGQAVSTFTIPGA